MGVAAAITTTGFFGMSFNLILLLSYQIFFGYIYSQIALMVTSFMAGLTLGGWVITNNLHRIRRGLGFFITIEMAIAVFCLSCGLFLTYINGIKEFAVVPIFYILSAITGSLVGIEFPLANRLYKNGDNPGMLYALDLFGGFFSALLVPIVLVPIFGVLKTALFLVLLKTMGLALFIPNSRRLG